MVWSWYGIIIHPLKYLCLRCYHLSKIKGTLSSWSKGHVIGVLRFRLTQWLKIIPHMTRAYYRCCCINEPVIFSHCVHLNKLGHRFHALLKVCSDRDDIVPLIQKLQNWICPLGAKNVMKSKDCLRWHMWKNYLISSN